MKKSILTLTVALSSLVAVACNSEPARQETEIVEPEVAEEALAHDEMSHTVALETATELPVFTEVSGDVKLQVQQLTNYYLEIKNALIAGNAAAAQAAATKLLAPLEQFNATALPAEQQEFYKKQVQQLSEAVTAIKNSADLAAQRQQLGKLTEPVYALNKTFDANESPLYRQYCPMANNNKGGYWLSAEQQVLNPYFGEKMLKCGKVAETL